MKLSDSERHDTEQLARSLQRGVKEGLLILFGALCVFLVLALGSYHPADPGWSYVGHDINVRNLVGRSGAWVADVLYSLFGYLAYLLPGLLVYGSALLVWRRTPARSPYNGALLALRCIGLLLLLTSGTALAALHFYTADSVLPYAAGGILGESLVALALPALNMLGATLVFLSAFLIGFTLFTGISWFRVMDETGQGALLAGDWLLRHAQSLSRQAQQRAAQVRQARQQQTASPVTAAVPALDDDEVAPASVASPGERREPVLGELPAVAWPSADPAEPHVDVSELAPEPPVLTEPVFTAPLAQTDEGVAAGTREASDTRGGTAADAKKVRIEAAQDTQPRPLPIEALQAMDGAGRSAPRSAPDTPLPGLELLDPPAATQNSGYSVEQLEEMSSLLERRLKEFGVVAEVVAANPGPVITRFEIQPAPGVKVSKISNLAKDLARSLAVTSVRVVEVIPGKSVVGIEIPNMDRAIIRLREVLASKVYEQAKSPLTLALGHDIAGQPVVADLAKMPHLLVAGTTGSGKSVGVNAMLLSMLYKATPDQLRLIMVDPKMLELSVYDGIPHLLTPVVTDMKDAANALRWCVAEMERRYKLMAAMGVRNLAGFNRKIEEAARKGTRIADPLWKAEEAFDPEADPPALETLPFIVVVIDEFADMMMIVGKKVEELIARIAQKARAAGIHLILATQRPSVDVITGLIKANVPTRMSFQVSTKIDSRTILDQGGAEQLLGHGDMLYLPPGSGVPIRIHGAFVDDDEVHRVVEDWKLRGEPDFVEEILNGGGGEAIPGVDAGADGDSEQDPLYDEAVAFVTETRRASISAVQRRFKIGYNRAARMIEAMEQAGVISPAGNGGGREVLAPPPPGVEA